MVRECSCGDRPPGGGLSSRMLVCLRYLSTIRRDAERPPAVPGVTATPVNSAAGGRSWANSTQDSAANAPPTSKKMRTTTSSSHGPSDVRCSPQRRIDDAIVVRGHTPLTGTPLHAVGAALTRSVGEPAAVFGVPHASRDATTAARYNTFVENNREAAAVRDESVPPELAIAVEAARDAGARGAPSVAQESIPDGVAPILKEAAQCDHPTLSAGGRQHVAVRRLPSSRVPPSVTPVTAADAARRPVLASEPDVLLHSMAPAGAAPPVGVAPRAYILEAPSAGLCDIAVTPNAPVAALHTDGAGTAAPFETAPVGDARAALRTIDGKSVVGDGADVADARSGEPALPRTEFAERQPENNAAHERSGPSPASAPVPDPDTRSRQTMPVPGVPGAASLPIGAVADGESAGAASTPRACTPVDVSDRTHSAARSGGSQEQERVQECAQVRHKLSTNAVATGTPAAVTDEAEQGAVEQEPAAVDNADEPEPLPSRDAPDNETEMEAAPATTGPKSCSVESESDSDFERATIPPMLAARPPIGNERAFVRVPAAAAAPFRHPLAVWDDAPWSDDDEDAAEMQPEPSPPAPEEPAPPAEPSPPCGLCPQYDSGDLSPLPMLPVRVRRSSFGQPAKHVMVHHECAEWAPEVYWTSDDKVVNLDTAYTRGRRMRCSACDTRGATIGCHVDSCRRIFHYRCLDVARCVVDDTQYAVYCEAHSAVPDAALFRSVTGAWACRVPEG